MERDRSARLKLVLHYRIKLKIEAVGLQVQLWDRDSTEDSTSVLSGWWRTELFWPEYHKYILRETDSVQRLAYHKEHRKTAKLHMKTFIFCSSYYYIIILSVVKPIVWRFVNNRKRFTSQSLKRCRFNDEAVHSWTGRRHIITYIPRWQTGYGVFSVLVESVGSHTVNISLWPALPNSEFSSREPNLLHRLQRSDLKYSCALLSCL